MSDESDQINQDEIEELLRKAQSSEDGEPSPEQAAPTPPAAADEVSLDQSEIEALMQQSQGAPATSTPSPPPVAAPASPPPPPATKPAAAEAPTNAASGESPNDIDLLLHQAQAALASIDQPTQQVPEHVEPFKLRTFQGSPASTERASLDLLRDVDLDVRIELGRTHMLLEEVLKLEKGAVVPLDKLAGDPVDIFVNGRLIARGEVLVLNDNFCVRIAELIVGESACA